VLGPPATPTWRESGEQHTTRDVAQLIKQKLGELQGSVSNRRLKAMLGIDVTAQIWRDGLES
jgi:hypothetical protein